MRSYYISSFDEIQRVSLYILIAIMCRDCAKIAILSLSILYRNRIQMIKSRYKGINFRKNYWKSWNCEMIIFILKYKRWRHCNNVIVMTSSRRREISDDALARISLRFVFTLWNKHSKTYSHWKMMPEKKFQPEIENLALKNVIFTQQKLWGLKFKDSDWNLSTSEWKNESVHLKQKYFKNIEANRI